MTKFFAVAGVLYSMQGVMTNPQKPRIHTHRGVVYNYTGANWAHI